MICSLISMFSFIGKMNENILIKLQITVNTGLSMSTLTALCPAQELFLHFHKRFSKFFFAEVKTGKHFNG